MSAGVQSSRASFRPRRKASSPAMVPVVVLHSELASVARAPECMRERYAPSLHVIGLPVLHTGDLVAFPLVDPIIELGAEVVVLGPLDRAATQALSVNLQILHGRA